MNFGGATDGPRALDTEVRGRVMWRERPECFIGAGDKEAQAVFQGPSPAHCEGLNAGTCDVDFACQSRIGLTYSTEQSTVVYQPSGTIINKQSLEKFVVPTSV